MRRTSPRMYVIWKRVSCCLKGRCRKTGLPCLRQPPLQRVRAGSKKLIPSIGTDGAVGPGAARLVVRIVKDPNLSVADRADTRGLDILVVDGESHCVAVD